MIKKEYFMTRADGVKLYRTYSDINHYIRQVETGNIYFDAIDIEGAPYTYEETDELIGEQEVENVLYKQRYRINSCITTKDN